MKKSYFVYLFGIILILFLIYLSVFLRSNRISSESEPELFRRYITNYTNKEISIQSSIRIEFSEEFIGIINRKANLKNIFKIYPSVKGSLYWLNESTIEYNPKDFLESNTIYTVKILLNKLSNSKVDKNEFIFKVKTLSQDFNITLNKLSIINNKTLKWQALTGIIKFNDFIDIDNVLKVFSLKANNYNKVVLLDKIGKNEFFFKYDSILRTDKTYYAELSINGSEIGLDKTIKKEIEIPSLGEFKLIDYSVVHKEMQSVNVIYSDPLDEDQLLAGLIRIEGVNDLKYQINGNIIKIYPNQHLKGKYSLIIEEGIKNILGLPSKEYINKEIVFEDYLPAVRFTDSSNIISYMHDYVHIPFQAVNLKAVDVRIIKIHQDNVLQFLQENTLSTKKNLSKVGNTILQKTIELDGLNSIDYGIWNEFQIDLTGWVNKYPGAIFNISIGFRKKYSLFNCSGTNNKMKTNEDDDEENFWYKFENFCYGTYDESKADNPCDESYYGGRRIATKNVLVTHLGITAKLQQNDSIKIYVNNIKNSNPENNVNIKAYSFQQQLLYSASTNSLGLADIPATDVYFIIVQKDEAKNYLVLADSTMLNNNNYEINGHLVNKGLQAYIFTEKQSWKPGDSCFVSMIIQTEKNITEANPSISMRLYSPKNELLSKIAKYYNQSQFYVFRTKIPDTCSNGIYIAKLKYNNVEYFKPLQVYKPVNNIYRINQSIEPKILTKDDTYSYSCKVLDNNGNVANIKDLIINYELVTSKRNFKDYEDYTFIDSTLLNNYNSKVLYKGKTDKKGSISIKSKISHASDLPFITDAIFTSRIKENNEFFGIKSDTISYLPYDAYLGMKIDNLGPNSLLVKSDTTVNLSLVVLKNNGKPVSKNHKLNIKVYEIDWLWNWKNSQELDKQVPIYNAEINAINGIANYSIKINHIHTGRYLAKVKDFETGHSSSLVFRYQNLESMDTNSFPSSGTFHIISDKKSYNVNDSIHINIPFTSLKGSALITVENGFKVLEYKWVSLNNENTISFLAKKEMYPNVYVNARIFFNQASSDKLQRYQSILAIKINDPGKLLHPKLEINKTVEPSSELNIKVSENFGKSMTYTIALIDESTYEKSGILPNPIHFFGEKIALGVKTWDTYKHFQSGQLIRNTTEDQFPAIDYSKSIAQNKTSSYLKYIGPFQLDENETKLHKIKLPLFVGKIKAIIIARNGKSYGTSTKNVNITKPLLLLPDMPEQIGINETLNLQIDLLTTLDGMHNINIQLITNDLMKCDEYEKNIILNRKGKTSIFFKLKSKNITGQAKIEIKATSGNITDIFKGQIYINSRIPSKIQTMSHVLEPGSSWQTAFSPIGINNTNEATIEVSSIPAFNLKKNIDLLGNNSLQRLDYELASAFALLFVDNWMNISITENNLYKEKINQAIINLSDYQTENGGFSLWPGKDDTDEWISSFAGHFMIIANEKKYKLPQGMLTKWIKFQQIEALRWNSIDEYSQFLQAYRLYTLALAGNAELSMLNHLRQKNLADDDVKLRLALAYKLIGKNKIAEQLIHNIDTSKKINKNISLNIFNDNIRNAFMLETLVLMDKKQEAFDLTVKISKNLKDGNISGAQSIAFSLFALSKYYKQNNSDENIAFSYSINKGKANIINSSKEIVQEKLPMQFTLDKLIEFKNLGENILQVSLILNGIPEKEDKATNRGISQFIDYKSVNNIKIDENKIESGIEFYANVSVNNANAESSANLFAYIFNIPSGWKFMHNMGILSYKSDDIIYQDISENMVITYFILNKGASKTLTFPLKASFQGKFYLPGNSIVSLDDDILISKNEGKWIEVKPGN